LEGAPSKSLHAELAKALAIWKLNSFLPSRDVNGGGEMVPMVASRINHSCVENAAYSFNVGSGMFEVFAARNIALGEEIVLSYADKFMPRATRRESLRKYNFVCTCALCDWTTNYGKVAETRRQRMLKYRVSTICAEGQVGRGQKPTDTTPSGISLAKACEELIKLMNEDDEGPVGMARQYVA